MFYIVSLRVKVYKNIIKVYNTALIKEVYQSRVNIALEYYRGISKPKGYNYILIVAIIGIKGGLLFITRFNLDIIIGILQVKLREYSSLFKLIK